MEQNKSSTVRNRIFSYVRLDGTTDTIMQKMTRLVFAFLFVCTVASVQAQDIHFSQFYMSPLNLNPAMTGLMNCNQRISVNYRNQWASVLRDKAFQTFSASYDQRATVGRYDYMGFGGTLWGDKAGSLGFGTTQVHGAFSYSKRMSGYRRQASYLSVGANVGLSQRSIDFQNARWGTQSDGAGNYNPGLPSQETQFTRPNFLSLDVTAGLLWFSTFDEKNNFYIGAAYNHINQANQSFTNNVFVPMYSKFTIHAGGEVAMNDRVGLVPGAVLLLQGPSTEVNLGSSIKVIMGNSRRSNEALQFGLWTRLGNKVALDSVGTNKSTGKSVLMDAIIASARFDYNEFTIGFSYDINVSPLSAASNGNGGFEFAFQYRICGRESRNVFCPNF